MDNRSPDREAPFHAKRSKVKITGTRPSDHKDPFHAKSPEVKLMGTCPSDQNGHFYAKSPKKGSLHLHGKLSDTYHNIRMPTFLRGGVDIIFTLTLFLTFYATQTMAAHDRRLPRSITLTMETKPSHRELKTRDKDFIKAWRSFGTYYRRQGKIRFDPAGYTVLLEKAKNMPRRRNQKESTIVQYVGRSNFHRGQHDFGETIITAYVQYFPSLSGKPYKLRNITWRIPSSHTRGVHLQFKSVEDLFHCKPYQNNHKCDDMDDRHRVDSPYDIKIRATASKKIRYQSRQTLLERAQILLKDYHQAVVFILHELCKSNNTVTLSKVREPIVQWKECYVGGKFTKQHLRNWEEMRSLVIREDEEMIQRLSSFQWSSELIIFLEINAQNMVEQWFRMEQCIAPGVWKNMKCWASILYEQLSHNTYSARNEPATDMIKQTFHRLIFKKLHKESTK